MPQLGNSARACCRCDISNESPQASQPCATELYECFSKVLESKGLACERVVDVTSSRVATQLKERLALAESGAIVIDMESYEIVAAANCAGVPAAVLRVVSDSLDCKMPDFDRALNRTETSMA